jgi:hypothetical protein
VAQVWSVAVLAGERRRVFVLSVEVVLGEVGERLRVQVGERG